NSGNYTVTQTVSGCTSAQSVATAVTINALPQDRTVAATTPTTICNGGTVSLEITSSESGIAYQLIDQASNVVSGLAVGTGGNIILTSQGLSTSVTTLRVRATNLITTCSFVLASTQAVTVQPNPNVSNAGIDLERCGTGSVTLNGNIPTVGTGSWSIVSGAGGSLINAALPNTSFSGQEGQVYTLSWTISNGVCPPTSDQMLVTITRPPIVFAGTNEAICENTPFDFSTQAVGASASHFSSILWTHTGAGTLFNSSSLTPTYIPQTGETGVVTFTLRANPNGTCVFAQSSMQLTINRTPVIDPVADIAVCSGATIPAITFTTNAGGGEIFTWTNTNPAIGLASSGIGSIGSFTAATNTTGNAVAGIIEVEASRASCTGPRRIFRITVFPEPVVAAIGNVTVCPGEAVNVPLSSNVTGAAVNWSNTNSLIGIGTGGSGSLSFTSAANNTGFDIVGTVSVTATKDGCTSAGANAKTFTITVRPTPVMTNAVASRVQTVCSGTPLNFVPTSNVGAAVYHWTSSVSGSFTGVSASGSGDITDTPVNTGSTTGTVTYTITPVANLCSGTSISFVVTVLPTPSADGPDASVCTDSGPVVITINNNPQNVTGTTFAWVADEDANVSGSADGNGSTINQMLSLSSGALGHVRYVVTPSANGCAGPTKTITVSVFRRAEVSAGPDLQLCADTPSIALQGSFSFSPSVTWTRDVGAGSFSNPNDPVASYSFVNPGEINSTVVLRLTAADPDGAGPCTVVSDVMNLRINPLPIVNFTGFPPGSPPQTAENASPITLTGNQVGGLFTISPVTSNIGTTVQSPPADQALFDPSAVELGSNFVTYAFTSVFGCTNQQTREILVNPVTTLDFGLQGATVNVNNEFEVCGRTGRKRLAGIPDVASGNPGSEFRGKGTNAAIVQAAIEVDGGQYFVNTDKLASGTYQIEYFYIDGLGNPATPITKIIQILAAPVAVINVNNSCIEDAIEFFSNTSFVRPTPFPTFINAWNWSIEPGITSNLENPTYNFSTAGFKTIGLRVTTAQGCFHDTTRVIRVGNVPLVDFRWSAICTNDSTRFNDLTVSAFSPVTTYTWDFGDGFVLTGNAGDPVPNGTHGGATSGTLTDPTHSYGANGSYTVVQTVNTLDGCTNTRTQFVNILLGGNTDVKPNRGSPYVERFDAGNGGWFAESIRLSGGSKVDSSWQWTASPPSSAFSAGASGSYWATIYRNAVVNPDSYVGNEGSVVNGPCFDLTLLERPMVSLDYFSDTETNLDGATLQFSTDGGNTWEIVGPPIGVTNRDEGINWFNGVGIPSNPGSQPVGNYGWTGKQGGWKTARFNLDMVPNNATARDQVRLRIGFAASDLNESGNSYDGFAFDNLFVGEKARTVLVEHFANATIPQNAEAYLNGLLATEISSRGFSDFVHIQYHVSTPGTDLLNQQNPSDPSARALFYNLSQPPRTIMDGIINPPRFVGSPFDVTRIEIDRRALIDPLFDMRVDSVATNNPETIGFEVQLTARRAVNSPLILQVALVEKTVTNAQGTFQNVLRKNLLGNAGATITNAFAAGAELIRTENEIEIDVPTVNSDQLMLVAYVQDRTTKEIYQSAILNVIYKRGRLVTSIEEEEKPEAWGALLNEMQVFPNPASQRAYVGAEQPIPKTMAWQVADQRGLVVLRGNFDKVDNNRLELDVKSLPNGLYQLILTSPTGAKAHKRLIVLNHH
nr:PKD domain-containing protein [Cyclobacteriaceae bacterium]